MAEPGRPDVTTPGSDVSAPAPKAAPGPDAPVHADGVTFELDGRSVTARQGEVVIAAAERAGVFIPRFCYHPRMEPVGMCRMCLVEVEGPRGATLQPSCFVTATEGMKVVTTSEKVKKAQDGVLEFLLVNHPLDCPVCDKGGECPLQDQTLAYGPGESRFVEEKRHFEKPIAISELVLLDRERCIQCSRCTRFAADVAGEAQIDFAGRGDQVEVAPFPTEPFSSYFAGNTVQICPVGALTATPYRFSARPWDLDQVESTCTTCSVGCRVAVQSSANRLTRLLGIDSDPVNQSWLCDKGRFVFEATNGDTGADARTEAIAADMMGVDVTGGAGRDDTVRLTEPLVRKDDELVAVSWGEALSFVGDRLGRIRDEHGPESVAVLGGARLTNEGAYAWAKLAKGVVGTDSVDAQLGDGLPAELVLGLPRATIDEACSARTVVLLTGDVREELPVLFLRLREAVRKHGTKLVEVSPRKTALTPYSSVSLRVRPGDTPAVVRALAGDTHAVTALGTHPEGPSWTSEELTQACGAVGDGSGVVVLVGRASLAESPALVADAVTALARALPGVRFLPALRRGNIHGALDMGLAPGLLPGRVALTERAGAAIGPDDADGTDRPGGLATGALAGAWGSVPNRPGRDATATLRSLAGEPEPGDDRSAVRALVLLGADPEDDFPDRQLAEQALGAAELVVLVGSHRSGALDRAHVVLPAASTHEEAGTTTNLEGRVSRLGQKLVPPGVAWPDWMIASEVADALGEVLGVGSMTDVWDEIEELAPAYAGLTTDILDAPEACDGVLVPLSRNARAPRPVAPIDPIATPGVESVERQGAPPRVGVVEPAGIGEPAGVGEPGTGGENASAPSALLGVTGPGADADGAAVPIVPIVDSYSLRLVSVRRLYDGGVAVAASPSLASLVPTAEARANQYDLDRIGAGTGDLVRVRSARGALALPAKVDPDVPRGVVAVDFNLAAPGGSGPANAAAVLIDATAPVTDVRLESM